MNRYKNRLQLWAAVACSLLAGVSMTSCDDEEGVYNSTSLAPGEWYVENVKYTEPDKNNPAIVKEVITEKSVDLTVSYKGLGLSTNGDGMALANAKQFIIRSNSSWKLVPKIPEGDSCNYVMMIPSEGHGEGRVRLALYPNNHLKARTVDYALVVNGVEQENIMLHIAQEPAEAYLSVGAPSISSAGGYTRVGVAANVAWTPEIDETDWIAIDSIGETAFRLNVKPNDGVETRSVNIRVKSADFPNLDKEMTVTQLPNGIYLIDNFDWLQSFLEGKVNDKGKALDQPNLYVNAGAQQHLLGDKKQGNELLPQNNGWQILGYGWLHTAACSCYVGWHTASDNHSGNGFLKIGRTSFFGEVTTPVLSAIEGTKDIKIRFKACAQTNNKSVRDGNILCIGVLRGAGTVKDANADITVGNFMDTNGTPGPQIPAKVMKFEVENLPDFNKNAAADVDIRDFRTYEVVITGADATTMISFIGGPSVGVDWINGAASGVANRIFIDEVTVTDVDREL